MIHQVRATWIEQLLKRSLYETTRIELGFETRQAAVDHPWDIILRQSENHSRRLPPGTRISDIYDQLAGQLLILGQPGVGKTTMLLELTRELLNRAETDEGHLLPVVFHLSSWGPKRPGDKPPTLNTWLAAELNVRYKATGAPREWGNAMPC